MQLFTNDITLIRYGEKIIKFRINAIEAIMNSDSEEAPDLIRDCLKDEDKEVQKNALIAMYNLEGRDIIDEVLLSNEYSDYLKEEAQDLLNEYEADDE